MLKEVGFQVEDTESGTRWCQEVYATGSSMMEFLLTVGGERTGATGIPPPVRDTPKTNLPIGSGVDQVIVIDSPTPPHDALT